MISTSFFRIWNIPLMGNKIHYTPENDDSSWVKKIDVLCFKNKLFVFIFSHFEKRQGLRPEWEDRYALIKYIWTNICGQLNDHLLVKRKSSFPPFIFFLLTYIQNSPNSLSVEYSTSMSIDTLKVIQLIENISLNIFP